MAASTTGKVTVLLVDDHAVVREGYRRLLERRVRGTKGGIQQEKNEGQSHAGDHI